MAFNSRSLTLPEPDRDPWSLLSPDRRKKAQALCTYLLGDGRLQRDGSGASAGLCERLVDAGLPLDRYASIIRILHSTQIAMVQFWEPGVGLSDVAIPYKSAMDDAYRSSPPAFAHEHGAWLGFDPNEIPVGQFDIVSELREAGFQHYICAPVRLANGMEDSFSFATKSASGFSAEDIALLRATFPAISACHEILVLERILKEVTRMYVGEEPHKRILSGDVHRGEVTRIEAAILFADMRGFTSLTADMAAEDVTALLNSYFDCIVPAIEEQGGEVLKFMGDGVLAIFREERGAGDACKRALTAAREGLGSVATRNETADPGFEVGMALHYGNVAFGNIGSGRRLDYTVVGRDVNLASRIATLCGALDARLLVSEGFRDLLEPGDFRSAGRHTMKGFSEPMAIFEPVDDGR